MSEQCSYSVRVGASEFFCTREMGHDGEHRFIYPRHPNVTPFSKMPLPNDAQRIAALEAENQQLHTELAKQKELNITAFEKGEASGFTNAHRELQAEVNRLQVELEQERSQASYWMAEAAHLVVVTQEKK